MKLQSMVVLAVLMGLAPAVAHAQTTDVVVIRRSIAVPKPRPTPTPTPAGITCGSLTIGLWSTRNTVAEEKASGVYTVTSAQSICASSAVAAKQGGTCGWNSSSGRVYYYGGTLTTTTTTSGNFVAVCK